MGNSALRFLGGKPSKKPKLNKVDKKVPIKKSLKNNATQANNASKCICPSPDWMSIAFGEMNKKIQRYGQQGKKGNHPTIMKYHNSTKLRSYVNKNVYNEGQSWCGTFVYWVLNEAGYNITFPTTFRAVDWAKKWGKKHGKKVKKPIYGAIGVKTRRGGGHVSFVVGVDNVKNPKYVYMLGGNQWGLVKTSKNNTISWATESTNKKGKPYIKSVLYPSRYRIATWDLGFYVPKEYDNKECCELKKYTGKFIISEKDGN